MRILVVEDEPLIAMLLEENLGDLGHETVGTAATVDHALALLDSVQVDGALLDFSLGDEATSVPVARRLRTLGTPFLYLSGHAAFDAAADAPAAPLLAKPVSLDALRGGLRTMFSFPAGCPDGPD